MPRSLPVRPPRAARLVGAVRLVGAAAVAVGLVGVLAGCTAPDGGGAATPAVRTTLGGTDDPTPSPAGATAVGDSPVQVVRGADGSESRISSGSAEMLIAVPVEIPLVAGDADLVQILSVEGTPTSYFVIITTPGRPRAVFPDLQAEFAAAGFATEDAVVVGPDGGSAGETAAGVFASPAYRVTVGLVAAGQASSTITYAIRLVN